MPFGPGTIVDAKYRVERELGRGGMGVVFAATHLALGTKVALKFLNDRSAANPTILERFLREARAAAHMRSEHICQVLDVSEYDGRAYLVMELLEGIDLAELTRKTPLDVATTADYVRQACTGLAVAHARSIVHRDLKPENLYLTKRENGSSLVKVVDFGVAKTPGPIPLTGSLQLLGSPAYCSPEQLISSRDADARSDIWALGVIMYRLVSGKLPFDKPNLAELGLQIMEENPRPLADVPDDFAAIVMRCLEKDPARRFGSVGELSAALRPFGTEESDTALFAGDPTDLVGATPMPSTSTVTLRKTPFIDAVPTVKGKKRPEDERGLEPTIQADVPIADTALRTNARPGLHADSRESAATIAKTAAFGLAGDTPTTDRTSAESAAITTANAEAARGSAPTLVGLGSPMPVQRESGLELPSGVVDAATDPRSVRVWVVVGAAAVVLTLVIAWRFSMSTDSTAAPAAQSVEVSAPVPAPAPPIPAPSVAEPAPAPAVEPVPEPAPQPTPKAAAAAPVEEEPVSTTPPAQAAGDSKKRPRGRRPTPTQSSTGAAGGSVTPPSDKEIGKSRI